MITTTGRALYEDAIEPIGPATYAGEQEAREACSRIRRLAVTYTRLQEDACNGYPDERREAQIERKIREHVRTLNTLIRPDVGEIGLLFTGDPRGYTVRLMLPDGRYNTWGGEESGWGVA